MLLGQLRYIQYVNQYNYTRSITDPKLQQFNGTDWVNIPTEIIYVDRTTQEFSDQETGVSQESQNTMPAMPSYPNTTSHLVSCSS